LPPFVIQEIAENGTPAQQAHARQNMASSWQIRSFRAATTGADSIIEQDDVAVSTMEERLIYDAEFGSILPGRLVRGEGDPPTADVAVNEAYDGAGATYDLYKDVYGRNSIDDRGMPLISSVHYRIGYDNAFWTGRQMVYGDGDEDLPPQDRLFNRFTISVDVIGHELTHGVTQLESGLLYSGQPGALNESISDIFGILVKQYELGITAAESNWIIGEGLFTKNVNGVGIRSMKEPGTAYNDPVIGVDPQPGHMRDYVNTVEDAGGVHINSGIPNRAFYVMAMEMGGNAWEKAGRIWYVTLRDKLYATADFTTAAQLTFDVAGDLYGRGSLEQQAVRTGWTAVGLEVGDDGGEDNPVEPPDPPAQTGCIESFLSMSFMQRLFGR